MVKGSIYITCTLFVCFCRLLSGQQSDSGSTASFAEDALFMLPLMPCGVCVALICPYAAVANWELCFGCLECCGFTEAESVI